MDAKIYNQILSDFLKILVLWNGDILIKLNSKMKFVYYSIGNIFEKKPILNFSNQNPHFFGRKHLICKITTLLIKILLRVCNFMFTSNSDYLSLNSNSSSNNLRSNDTNTTLSSISQLIKLTTETTLMSVIKATYNFNLSNDLWDQLVTLLQTVNSNHDVVDKWMDSIDDLMRQIFKHTYNIDLNSFKSPYQNEDETEADLNARSAVSSSRSGSVSSQVDEKRKQRHKNRDKQNHQSLILNSSSSNYLLAHASQSNEKRGTKTDNNMTYSPAVLSSVGLNKPSFQNSQNNSQIPFNRQTSAKHSLQNTFRDDTYLHTIVPKNVQASFVRKNK
ncbi:ral GTPase-activating subunit alpha-1 isoform X5 [Brachionus plicatilis]|uniref:Ral GTPase-activating subunit alpha-1 isoform X5 n=1 Tax=Brachionus plicatilis TaxID=10195 RepID=A0A3M7SK68_BRAPC|nr:ral GTPase-activating subunit alpha-1 isoform X5 [Brachionus plicatilis]